MTIEIQRPSTLDVTKTNPNSILYVEATEAGETTEGSIRFILREGDSDVTLEQLTDGVFNPTGLRIAASTLFLDREQSISSIATNLQVNNTEQDKKFLIPDVEFDDIGTKAVKSPILNTRVDNFLVQPIFNTEITTTSISGPFTFGSAALIHTIHLKTGTTAATDDVNLQFTRGLTPGGTVVFDLNLPASSFPANSDVEIDLGSGIGFCGDKSLEYCSVYNTGSNSRHVGCWT